MTRGAKVWTALWAVYVIWGRRTSRSRSRSRHPPAARGVDAVSAAARSWRASSSGAAGRCACRGRRSARASSSAACSRGERRALLRGAERADRARVADHRVGAALGGRAPAVARERLSRAVLVGVGVGFAGVAMLARPVRRRDRRGIAPLRPLGGDVVGRLGARRAAADAGRPVRRDLLGDARRRARDAAVRARRRRLVVAVPQSVLAWVYLVTSARSSATRPTCGCSRTRRSGLVSTYAYVNPVVAIVARRPLPRRAPDVARWGSAPRSSSSAVALVVTQEPPAATQPEEGVR